MPFLPYLVRSEGLCGGDYLHELRGWQRHLGEVSLDSLKKPDSIETGY